jgi:hypothetical protein
MEVDGIQDGRPAASAVHCGAEPRHDDSRGAALREQRLVDAGDVIDVGPTPVMRALIGLAVGLAVGALLALLIPRRGVRRL